MTYVYTKTKEKLLNGALDLDDQSGHTWKADLVDLGTYTADEDADEHLDDVSGLYGTPVTLSGITISVASNKCTFDFSDVTFSSVPAGTTYEAMIVYDDQPATTSSKTLLMLIDDFGAGPGSTTITPNGGDIVIALGAYAFRF